MPPSSIGEVTALSSRWRKIGLPRAWGSFSQELTNHLGPDARPDCSPLGAGSDCQGLIFKSWELHPGHDLIQACVLLLCQHYLCWYHQLCPIWPTSVHLHTTHTNTHGSELRRGLAGHFSQLAALTASSLGVPPLTASGVVPGKT